MTNGVKALTTLIPTSGLASPGNAPLMPAFRWQYLTGYL